MTTMKETPDAHRARVRAAYAEIARTRNRATGEPSDCCAPDCCGGDASGAHGDYSADEIAAVPAGAFLGEGSGNPVRAARLQPGETVIDLGSGAGMDAFLAASRVGPQGRVTGYDMTPDMLARARRLQAEANVTNVTFEESDIASLPAAAGSVDAVLSNCVINLTPDKAAVYREIYRVLRPGGRFAVADIVLRGDAQRVYANADRMSGCSCIAGALEEDRYLASIRAAGFTDVRIVADRAAASDAELRGFSAVLDLDPARPEVEARAITVTGTRPTP